MTSAVGTLKGPLHGGANEAVMKLLLEIRTLDRVEPFVKQLFADKKKIPGFGHRVYRVEDLRAKHMKKFSKQLAETIDNLKWYEMSEKMEEIVKNEKGPPT